MARQFGHENYYKFDTLTEMIEFLEDNEARVHARHIETKIELGEDKPSTLKFIAGKDGFLFYKVIPCGLSVFRKGNFGKPEKYFDKETGKPDDEAFRRDFMGCFFRGIEFIED